MARDARGEANALTRAAATLLFGNYARDRPEVGHLGKRCPMVRGSRLDVRMRAAFGPDLRGALALKFCDFALLLRLLALVRGLIWPVLFVPELGAEFVYRGRAFVGALAPFVRRSAALSCARLAVVHRGLRSVAARTRLLQYLEYPAIGPTFGR
jgi:hypothetical protein